MQSAWSKSALMRAVVQRVSQGRVVVDGQVVGEIGKGLVVLLGIKQGDSLRDVEYLAEKILQLRIFEDAQGKMNLSSLETNGALLVVSQFTLYGDCTRGRRPSYQEAAPPQEAEPLYECFRKKVQGSGLVVASGVFGAKMTVEICNDGPVTLILDS